MNIFTPASWRNLAGQQLHILTGNVTVNNSIVPVDCMSVAVVAGTWWFEVLALFSAVGGADFYAGMDFDGGGQFLRHGTESDWNGTYAYPTNIIGDRLQAQYIVRAGNNDLKVARHYGWAQFNAAGNLKFRFCQHTAQVNDCIVYAKSYLRAVRVA